MPEKTKKNNDQMIHADLASRILTLETKGVIVLQQFGLPEVPSDDHVSYCGGHEYAPTSQAQETAHHLRGCQPSSSCPNKGPV